jgi:hypothetical protein
MQKKLATKQMHMTQDKNVNFGLGACSRCSEHLTTGNKYKLLMSKVEPQPEMKVGTKIKTASHITHDES